MRILVQRGVVLQYESVGKGCALQGFPSSLSDLDTRLKTEPAQLLLSDLKLVIRLKGPAEETQVHSSTLRGKAMFHKTTLSLLKINLH